MVTVSFQQWQLQLDSFGIQHGETGLRKQIVEHLQSHPYTHDGSFHFWEYISALVVSGDPSNADTEASNEQWWVHQLREDPRLQQQLRYLRNLERLNGGALGDHIAVQGLADMLHVDIYLDINFHNS